MWKLERDDDTGAYSFRMLAPWEFLKHPSDSLNARMDLFWTKEEAQAETTLRNHQQVERLRSHAAGLLITAAQLEEKNK